MGIRGWVKRLEQSVRGETIEIPQRDGTIARFTERDLKEAFVAIHDGRDHPLAQAARNSSEPQWANSFYSAFPTDAEVEDLSE